MKDLPVLGSNHLVPSPLRTGFFVQSFVGSSSSARSTSARGRPSPPAGSPGGPAGQAWRDTAELAATAATATGAAALGASRRVLAGLWIVGFAVLGGATGAIDNYLAGMMSVLGLIAAGYAIQAALRLREEEAAGHAEPVLSTATSRLRWAGGHLAFSLLGPAAALATGGLAMGLTHGLNTGDVGGQLPQMLTGALVQLPAVWVLAGVTVALFGLLPRFAPVSWGGLAGCLLLVLAGTALQLDQWVLDLSPFAHLPRLPGGEVTSTPLVALTAVAAALTAVGLAALRRRTVPSV